MANTKLVPTVIGGGHAISDNALMCHTIPDDLNSDDAGDFTRIFYLHGENSLTWNHQDWPNATVVSTCDIQNGPGGRPAGVSLSNHGLLRIANSVDTTTEQIPGAGMLGKTVESMRGVVNCLRSIGPELFVCGHGGQVYRKDYSGWLSISGKMGVLAGKLQKEEREILLSKNVTSELHRMVDIGKRIPNLLFINGSSRDDLYVTGSNNTIYHFDGEDWERIRSDTSNHLSDLHVISQDEVYIAGFKGTILKGNAKVGFSSIVGGVAVSENFIHIRKFQGVVYAGNDSGLFRVQDGRIEKVSDYPGKQVRCLDNVSENILWILSSRHAYRFDGKIFIKHEHPDNIDFD